MKLKEFVLWAYKLDLSDSRAFTLENRCVCAHFERHFRGGETEDIYRVVIKLSEYDPRNGTTDSSNSVLKFYESFDFDYLHSLIGQEKKRYLLETLVASLVKLCELTGWESEPFKLAKQKVIEEEFDNSYEVARKNNRSRNMVAILNAQHTEKEFSLSVVVKDKRNNKIIEKQVLSVEPDEFIFNSQIGDLRWSSHDVLTYRAKDKSTIETIHINSNG